jgi:hypothetical protein
MDRAKDIAMASAEAIATLTLFGVAGFFFVFVL